MNRAARSIAHAARNLFAAALGGLALWLTLGMLAEAKDIRVTDLAGREVVLKEPAKRIVLGAWVSLDALSLLHPDPVSLLAGWAEGGANTVQPSILRGKFPAIDRVPVVGRGSFDAIGIEPIIANRPDLVLLSRFDAYRYGSEAATGIAQLEAAGIQVAIVDFFLDPLTSTEPSLRILGKLIGREAQAEAFIAFYREHLGRIAARLEKTGLERPSVFLHAFAARPECCFSAGPGTIDGFIRLAGGLNIGAEMIPGPVGQLSLEFVLTRNPRVYVATTTSDNADPEAFALGPAVSAERATRSFATRLARRDLASLDAVAQGRAHGLWHLFVHTPVHVAAIEALARWQHPELFFDVDPDDTLRKINSRFLAAPLEGTFWVSAGEGAAKR